MIVGTAQINTTIGDFPGNRARIIDVILRAAERQVDLVVFPEMSICGYPPMDLLDHEAFVQENLKSLRIIQKSVPGGIAAALGYVDRNRESSGKSLRNVVSVIAGSRIIHTQAKSLLPTYDVFDETRYFEAAPSHTTFEFKGECIGIAICEDLWWEQEAVPGTRYALDPVNELLDRGAGVILSPSASPYFSKKVHTRLALISKIGKSSGVPVVYVNMTGGNDSLIFDGNSLVTSGDGSCIYRGAAFEEDLGIIDMEKSYPRVSIEIDTYQEIELALVTGLKDYLRKCGFSRVHLGLSGGIDSALVAVLAVKALGPEQVHAFAMPSRYSSHRSEEDARHLAENLGISFDVISIEEVFPAFLSSLQPHFHGKKPDVTEENIQARIRGTLMMAYSNKWHSLLLVTGNKSELATGYCTLYGDMCGGLAVIGDLLKTEVYELARHINREGKIIPESILKKPPSAELRPGQEDQDSLPPYEVLDEILKLYVLENLTKEEIIARGFDEDLISRTLTLVGRAEYKRRQSAPVLKVSSRAFGTGRRMPIARNIYEA